ncbi:MAG: hypothetical protein HGB04_09590 [Chlorobiaceae bacterium]|nr:hypothetical protein [Chlorobiaceae bacterium]
MNDQVGRPAGFRPTVAGVLNALLSVTFLVLAAYIAWSSTLISGPDVLQLRLFACVMAAYGLWRWIRSRLKDRREDE